MIDGAFENVQDYGAVGDGVTNDTAAFTAAVTAAKVRGGIPVYVPNGTYIVNSTLELGMAAYNNTEGSVSIIGESTTRTIIRPGVTGTTALFQLTGGNTNYRTFARIENLTVDSGVFKNGQGCAIKIDSTIGNNVRNVIIRNMKYGVWLYAGTSFGGAGWVEYNDFENVTTDFCDECYRLEQDPANTNPIPSHGYNNFRHCLGNVFLLNSTGANKQIFFHLVNSTVNFYNSHFDFFVSTQDGGTLIYANGNGGGPLGAGREGLTPSNSGSILVESSGGCYLYGTQRFWWQGLFSYVSSNLFDYAGISAASPGQSVFLCDNYVYSGTDINDPAQIDRFLSSVLTPNYPLGRVGQNAPYISVEDSGLRKGMVVYADQSDSGAIFGLGLRAAGAKLQAITMNWWQAISGKLLANKYGFRVYSDVVNLSTSPTTFASFPAKAGSFIVTIKGVANDYPAYTFSVSKNAPFGNKQIATLSAAPKTTSGETLTVTWPDNDGIAFQTSAAGADGAYNITVMGTTA